MLDELIPLVMQPENKLKIGHCGTQRNRAGDDAKAVERETRTHDLWMARSLLPSLQSYETNALTN